MKKIIACLLLCAMFCPLLSQSILFADDGEPDEEDVIATGLPVVHMDLYNGATITDRDTWMTGKFQILNTEEYADCENLYTEEGGLAELKGRGNSTWWQFETRKRAYSLKLEEKTSLFGMEKSKRWVLLANFMDRSNLRNKFVYDLSGRLGLEYCSSVFVNFYLNGRYQGVYQLCEMPSAPIDDWEELGEDIAKVIIDRENLNKTAAEELLKTFETDLTWMTEEEYHGYRISDYTDLSSRSLIGNYLIEYDYYFDEPSKFETNGGVPLNIRSPEALATDRNAMRALTKHINSFESAVLSENYRTKTGYHYSAYADMDSLVDYYIVNALIKNVEFGYKSMYLYTDTYGMIYFGPCWDYDWSSGNHFLGAAPNPEAWYDDWRASTNTWYHALYGDPYFVARVQERWFEMLPIIEEEIERLSLWEDYLAAASNLERNVYLKLDGEDDYRRQSGKYSFADEVEDLRQFLRQRVAWMTEQFSKKNPNIEGAGTKLSDFSLQLRDQSGELSSNTDSPYPVQYTTEGQEELTATAEVAVTFTLNGSLLTENSTEAQISPSQLRPGINVLIAERTEGGKLRQDAVLFTTPADDPGFVDIRQETDEAPSVSPPVINTPIADDGNANHSVQLWIGALAAVVLLGGIAFLSYFIRKRKRT